MSKSPDMRPWEFFFQGDIFCEGEIICTFFLPIPPCPIPPIGTSVYLVKDAGFRVGGVEYSNDLRQIHIVMEKVQADKSAGDRIVRDLESLGAAIIGP